MPNRDKTGPNGDGPKTGRRGNVRQGNGKGQGQGMGSGRSKGSGRGSGRGLGRR